MSKSIRKSVTQLANEAGIELDETLIRLWDLGFNEIKDQNDHLSGQRLNQAKASLGIATKRQLTSFAYWQLVLSLNEEELRTLLRQLGIHTSPRAKTLPTGALRRLKSYSESRMFEIKIKELEPKSPTVYITKNKFVWHTVGREREVVKLEMKDVLAIHEALCQDFLNHSDPIEPPGPRDPGLLESAIFRQHTSAGDSMKYPTVEMTAAALLHSMVLNHPFYNGNKRTALVAMLVLLDENGLILKTNEDELFKFILLVAQHRIVEANLLPNQVADAEVIAIAEWIRSKSRNIEMGERTLPFRKLKQILASYGCEFIHSSNGCNVKITRKVKESYFSRSRYLYTNISYGNEGRDVLRRTINKIRTELQLDEENGIDSTAFYENEPLVISDFIVKYRKTLQRLAKV